MAEQLNTPKAPTDHAQAAYHDDSQWPHYSCYRELDPLRQEVRILTLLAGSEEEAISCTISTESLPEVEPFAALSYCWGTAGETVAIFINCAFLPPLLVVWDISCRSYPGSMHIPIFSVDPTNFLLQYPNRTPSWVVVSYSCSILYHTLTLSGLHTFFTWPPAIPLLLILIYLSVCTINKESFPHCILS